MMGVAVWYGFLVLLVGVCFYLFLRRDGWRQWAAPLVLAGVYAVLLVGMARGLGRPLPTWAMPGTPPDAVEVLWYRLDEGKAIYVLIAGEPPLYLALPWNMATAEALYAADRARSAMGQGARLKAGRKLFEPSLETREPMVYPDPPPALPPKDGGDD